MLVNHTKSKDPKIENLIEIDCRKTIADVYTDLTLYFLNLQSGFGFLSHVEDVNFEERKWNLPTWVPDWTSSKVSTEAKWRLQKVKTHKRIHDVRDIHVVMGEKAVLSCIGTKVSGVEMIKNEIPRREDVLALCHKIKNSHLADRKMTVRLVYEHFCAWFNTSETSPDNFIPKDLEETFERGHNSGEYHFNQRMELISQIADPADPQPLKDYTKVLHLREYSKGLWMYIFMAMTDVNGTFLGGKKLAVLGNGKIALVSVRMEVGDGIWSCNREGERLCSI